MKRPDRFPQSLDRLAPSSAHGLCLTRVTMKPVRSETWKVNALRELQVKGGEELRPFFGRTLMASVLDRAFKGEL